MKSKLTIMVFVLLLVLPAALFGQSVDLIDSALVFREGKKTILVKKMPTDTDFYGYDLVDNTHVFLAYRRQNSTAERAILALYDIESEKEKIIDEVPAARTTRFIYNRENGLVLFNGIDGIYTLRIKGFLSGLSTPKRIMSGADYYKVFWIDANTFGYNEFDEKTRQVVTKHALLP